MSRRIHVWIIRFTDRDLSSVKVIVELLKDLARRWPELR